MSPVTHWRNILYPSKASSRVGLLAEYGYGEDAFGNNIALPEKLAYLRR